MPDNPLVVALLKEFAKEESITKTEVGRIIGKNRNQVAGIWNRSKAEIGPWPKLNQTRRKNRGCQFPINRPGSDEFHICGIFRSNDPLLCNEHQGKKWTPECQVLPMKK